MQPRQMVLWFWEFKGSGTWLVVLYITNHFTKHILRYHLFWRSKYEAIKDDFGGGSTKCIYDYYCCTLERAKLKLFVAFSCSMSLSDVNEISRQLKDS
jgi:hypothetical protein